jgi:hypothetical protein
MRISAVALSFTTATLVRTSQAFVSPNVRVFGATARGLDSSLAVTQADLDGAQEMIDGIILEKNCNPFFVRLAWHDSGTYDVNVKGEWPAAGGAIGSIRFDPEINHGANAGLSGALKLLEPVKKAYPDVSYADIFQMASARGIELAGGPKIDMKYGRVDASSADQCAIEGNLPDAEPGEGGMYGGCKEMEDKTAAGHLRKVFYRMGLNDEVRYKKCAQPLIKFSMLYYLSDWKKASSAYSFVNLIIWLYLLSFCFRTSWRSLELTHSVRPERRLHKCCSSQSCSHLDILSNDRTCIQGPLWSWCRENQVY